MPLPRNRSNSVRKIKYRAPCGASRTRYRRRKKGKAHRCALSGKRLSGVSSAQGVAKTKRRPSRPFGGRLSPSAARKVIKLRARLEHGEISLGQVPIGLLPYVGRRAKG